MDGPHTESTTQASAPERPGLPATDLIPPAAFIAYGALTVVLGIALLAWPGATLLVAIAFLAIQIALTGVVQIARALSPWATGAGERTLLAISGALAFLVALLILRRPLQTLVLIAVLAGGWWIVRGVIDVVSAASERGAYRVLSVLSGLVSVIAGIYVLLSPGISLLVFVWVTGLWMILSGAALALGAVMLLRPSSPHAAR